MLHVKLLFMILGLTFILTACGNPVKAKLHETNSGFNAQITGKTKHKKVYWQIGDTIHTTKTTDDAFAFEVPYKAKQYRITLADNEEMRNPTYVEGPVAKEIVQWPNFIQIYNPIAQQKELGVFEANPLEGIRTDQVDSNNVIAMNVSDSKVLGISIKALNAGKNLTFKNYVLAFSTSIGTKPTQITELVDRSLKKSGSLMQLTDREVRYTVMTTNNNKQQVTQLSINHL
ncbi:hypothetical protein [Latilactobacillus curvatus]|uniref:hypothetical protein n=1 Tax=Latilactobacillus curvatus TaxID=28038 RepID=UPI000B5F65F8|nr:hypothetical protein [Latilactobacillus curvatus]ASN62145.1 hypothetical protein CGZ47_06155 [Latilactobacillus curvatus]MCT2880938.1 hypothetical protein [Latilactobacillus curvatus]